MTCHEFESLMLDSLDAHLTKETRAALDAHLAACAGCRAFAGAQKALDARLSASLAFVAPPARFKERVLARVRAERTVPRAERLPLTKWLDAAAWLASAGAAAYVLGAIVPPVPPVPAVPPHAALLAGYALGAAALAFGLWAGFGRDARRMVRAWL